MLQIPFPDPLFLRLFVVRIRRQANEVAAKRTAIKDKLGERETSLARLRERLQEKKVGFDGEELLRGEAVE